jgi:hypothetical protein
VCSASLCASQTHISMCVLEVLTFYSTSLWMPTGKNSLECYKATHRLKTIVLQFLRLIFFILVGDIRKEHRKTHTNLEHPINTQILLVYSYSREKS